MMKVRLAAFVAVAVLVPGAAHATAVPVREALPVPPVAAVSGVVPGAAQDLGRHEEAIGLAIAPGLQMERGGTARRVAKDEAPLHAYLLSAGHYVLEVGSLSEAAATPSEVANVPLPGALWLFGSALVAFLGISSRRKL